jgi:DNA-binding transcriptional LysR family regulator
MELRHLRYFLAVAEELHFGRAADKLRISQPPLSLQIRQFEEELGAPLFERSSRSVRLTPAGEALLPEARELLERAQSAAELARRVANGEEGRLRVTFVRPMLDAGLPEAIRAYRNASPRVRLELVEMNTREQLDELRAGQAQLGFVRLYEHELDGLETALILREPYVVALPIEHRLARKPRIALRDLQGEPLIIYPKRVQPKLYERMLAACEAEGYSPRVSQETLTIQTSIALVAAGLGVSFVPASSAKAPRKGALFRELAPGLPEVEIWAAWERRSHHDPRVQGFLAAARSASNS